MWRTLQHPNILPLIGVMMSESQFAMVSDWMTNGTINDFVKAYPDADRLELVGVSPRVPPSSFQVHSPPEELSSWRTSLGG